MNISDNTSDTYSAPIRVRMAPSPTGFFHVGSARTALFNYLFAEHAKRQPGGGAFVLRIEDTDQQRNDPEYERVIYEAMNWLGLHADESPQHGGDFGPYHQSKRFDLYREYVQKLVDSGAAYPAYETADELAAMRAEQQAHKQPPRYTGAQRDLTAEQRAAFEAQGRKSVIRFKVPEGETAWDDVVRGRVVWKNTEIDDFVILKGDGTATYNFACVVDDALMKMTHIIRGEDGTNNTPRQLMIYHALGFEPPKFAHVPFLLGRDRSKLSKRNGDVNLLDYRDKGILPEAMFNYLALLGWNPGEGETQEIFTRDELIERFSLERVSKAAAIFDVEKLQWMNTQYLKAMPIEQFATAAGVHLKDTVGELNPTDEYTQQALELARERIHSMHDIRDAASYFFQDDFAIDEAGAAKHLTPEKIPNLSALHERLAALDEWNHDTIENAIRTLATERGIKPAELIHPSRLAVSGRTVGPSLFELLAVLGRERVLSRMQRTVDSLGQ